MEKENRIRDLLNFLMKEKRSEDEFYIYLEENKISMEEALAAISLLEQAQKEFDEELKEEVAKDILER